MSVKKPSRNPHARTRRKLLQSALLGGAAATFYAAPERWTRPVIESVSLPAHAQTSPMLGEGPWTGGGASMTMTAPFRNRNLAGRIVDTLVPRANAAFDIPRDCGGVFGICIDRTDDDDQVQVRSGFDGCVEDDRIVTLSGSLDFSFEFGPFSVNGEYDPSDNRWFGRVMGPCDDIQMESSNGRPGNVFTGERIQVAAASGHIMLAGSSDPEEQIEIEWTADQGDCGLTDCEDE